MSQPAKKELFWRLILGVMLSGAFILGYLYLWKVTLIVSVSILLSEGIFLSLVNNTFKLANKPLLSVLFIYLEMAVVAWLICTMWQEVQAYRILMMLLIVIIKTADVFAYVGGRLFARRPQGNHLLCPRISPQKSYEGLLCGTAAAVIVAVLLRQFFGLTVGLGICLGVGAAILGLAGDLLESKCKRLAQVKDSGFLPGYGGFLDIADSLTIALPILWYGVQRFI